MTRHGGDIGGSDSGFLKPGGGGVAEAVGAPVLRHGVNRLDNGPNALGKVPRLHRTADNAPADCALGIKRRPDCVQMSLQAAVASDVERLAGLSLDDPNRVPLKRRPVHFDNVATALPRIKRQQKGRLEIGRAMGKE